MPNTIKTISLTDDDKSYLNKLLTQSTLEIRVYQRARILLLKSEGASNKAIADKLDIGISVVKRCLNKFKENGVEASLRDNKGRGRKAEITDDDITWVISKACQKPKDYGYSAEFWYPMSFRKFINSIAETEGHPRMATVAETTLRKILSNARIKPFQVSYYCERRDPEFDAKMHDVLVIYKQIEMQFDKDGKLIPFEKDAVHTLSYDEKPGIQAIATTGEDRPPIPNTDKSNGYQRDYEYVRLGILSLLAAIDLLSGEAIPLVSETHKSSDFVTFLKKLDEKYPKGDMIRIILDNHSAHTSKETQEYLNTVSGRFEFVFTPKHGSWLNMIEGFFSKMTKQMLGGIRVESKKELEDRIYRYFDEINKEPVPYKWTYKMDTIDLSQEDIDSIVYEVVNAKAASAENKNKKAPKTLSEMKKNCFARMHPSLKTASVPDAPASVVAAPEDSSNPDSQSSETVVSERQDVKPERAHVPDIRRRRSMTLPDYKKTFLVRVDYDLRASLYVSAPTKRKILEVLKKIGDRDALRYSRPWTGSSPGRHRF